jgi:hypothetical protein
MTLNVEHSEPAEWWTVPGQSFQPMEPENPAPFWVMPAGSNKTPPDAAAPAYADAPDTADGASAAPADAPDVSASSLLYPVAPAPSTLALPTPGSPGVSGELADLLTRITDDLTRAAVLAAATTGTESLCAQTDETVLSVLIQAETASRQLGCVQTHAAAIVDDRSPYDAGPAGLSSRYGHRRAAYLIEDFARISRTDAYLRVRVGAAARSHLTLTGDTVPATYPTIGTALDTGNISVDSAGRIISGLDQARKNHTETDTDTEQGWEDNFRAAEGYLVDVATDTPPDILQPQIQHWRDALDPDGTEPREDEIRSRRGLRRISERNGIVRYLWDTTGEDSALMTALLAESDAAAAPKFYCPDDNLHLTQNGVIIADPAETARLLNTGTLSIDDPNITGINPDSIDPEKVGVVTKVTDLRTREQRHSDTLAGYLRAGLRAPADGTGHTRSLATVTAVVSIEDLKNGVGVGWIDGISEPVSIATIEQLICNGGVRTAILGDHGEVLHLGHTRRLFSKAIRHGVTIRDGGCASTGCTKPAAQTDVHHVIPWSEGGKTNIDNAVLLCPEHHRQIHTSAFTMTMVNGKPFLTAPRWLDPAQTRKALGKARHRTRNSNRMNR